MAPGWLGSKSNISQELKTGSRGTGGGFGKERLVLVVSETALASILLIGAGLSLRSLWRAETVALGFDPSNVLTFKLTAPPQYTGAAIPLFYRQVTDRIKALPGVESAVLARNLPMSGVDPSMAISIEGALRLRKFRS
jgi:putative ABC transport system permease protein